MNQALKGIGLPHTRWAQKSKPLSLMIIKSVLKPAIMARFFITFDYKMNTRI